MSFNGQFIIKMHYEKTRLNLIEKSNKQYGKSELFVVLEKNVFNMLKTIILNYFLSNYFCMLN